jgi:sulfur relay (sulfurtransferase) DsrC/TusE family protein
MTTIELIGVDRDAGGFLTDPQQWNEEIAAELACEAGIDELTPRHWQVVRYMRDTYLATGEAPSIRTLGKASGVGNPGLHLATWLGGVPGMSSIITHQMAKKMEELDIPPIPEFVELIADSGGRRFACKASVDMFDLTKDDFIDQVEDIITVGEFYGLAAGGQIIFT